MKEKEKQLFKALCKFKEPLFESALVEFATPTVLGHLFFNRMQGVAYDTLKQNGLLGEVNREFRNSLEVAYEQNLQKNRSFCKCVTMLNQLFSSCKCNIAMLKGAYLCVHYPEGYRTSNDIDLLILPKDVTTVGDVLASAGFKQGSVKNSIFIPATRKEIIESKMMRGETVPYIKEVNLPFMKFLEVDINFSLDYKNGDDSILENMLSNVYVRNEKGVAISTFDDIDFFIHLCAHLYKEATTLPWIEMKRDMTLYKYCDIYMLLSEMSDEKLQKVFDRAKKINMEKICAYAILETMKLFDMNNIFAHHIANTAISDDPEFCIRVFSPKDKKTLFYQTADTTERFFAELRLNDLKEREFYENA